MRYRKMTADGDYLFGAGSSFLIDSPATVAQAVLTRLRLFTNEWFLDHRIGLDRAQILGNGTQHTRDAEVQQRIIGTEGALSILEYQSRVDARDFTVEATIDTIYGQVTITEKL